MDRQANQANIWIPHTNTQRRHVIFKRHLQPPLVAKNNHLWWHLKHHIEFYPLRWRVSVDGQELSGGNIFSFFLFFYLLFLRFTSPIKLKSVLSFCFYVNFSLILLIAIFCFGSFYIKKNSISFFNIGLLQNCPS